MSIGLFGLFGLLGSGDNYTRRTHEAIIRDDPRKIEEMKRKNDLAEKELFLKEISQASDKKILDMLKPKTYMVTPIITGGINFRKELDSYERIEELPNDKYELVKDEAIKRKLIT